MTDALAGALWSPELSSRAAHASFADDESVVIDLHNVRDRVASTAVRAWRLLLPVSVCAVALMLGCSGSERAATKTPAATVEDAPEPAEPGTVTLTPDV